MELLVRAGCLPVAPDERFVHWMRTMAVVGGGPSGCEGPPLMLVLDDLVESTPARVAVCHDRRKFARHP